MRPISVISPLIRTTPPPRGGPTLRQPSLRPFAILVRLGLELAESPFGYKPPWAGQMETQPRPIELHALITPPELLHLTQSGPVGCRRGI